MFQEKKLWSMSLGTSVLLIGNRSFLTLIKEVEKYVQVVLSRITKIVILVHISSSTLY